MKILNDWIIKKIIKYKEWKSKKRLYNSINKLLRTVTGDNSYNIKKLQKDFINRR